MFLAQTKVKLSRLTSKVKLSRLTCLKKAQSSGNAQFQSQLKNIAVLFIIFQLNFKNRLNSKLKSCQARGPYSYTSFGRRAIAAISGQFRSVTPRPSQYIDSNVLLASVILMLRTNIYLKYTSPLTVHRRSVCVVCTPTSVILIICTNMYIELQSTGPLWYINVVYSFPL